MSCSDVLLNDASYNCITRYGHRWKFYGSAHNITVQNSTLWTEVAYPINKARGRDDMVLRLRKLAQVHVRYSSQRLYILLRREGWLNNHQRVHRLHCLESELAQQAFPTQPCRCPLGRLHQNWSMDFVADNLCDSRKIRTLTIVDDFSRQCLDIYVGQSLKGEDVVAVLQRLHQQVGVVI